MNETDIRKYAELMKELGLTGLEITEDKSKVRLERSVPVSAKETVSSMHEVYDNASAQKGKADSVGNLLKQVVDAAYAANEVARNIENEIAYQREITDEAKNALKA